MDRSNDKAKFSEKYANESGRPIWLAGSVLGNRCHVCAFFSGRDEEYQVLLPFVRDGLERGEKVVHTVDPERCGEHLERLKAGGIDVATLLQNRRFYSVFLLLVALGLELVARHAHHRSKQMRIAGFRYHRHHDVWECPTGQQLKPVATDYGRRLVRYRAPAHICNACSIKHLCTESEEDREIEHHPDSWLESEIARFHRGISLALLFLAGLLLVVEMIRHQRPMELLILSGFLVPIALLGSQMSAAFLASRRVVVDKDKETFRSSNESRF